MADLLTGQIMQAVGLFAVTNIDDIVILALFFSRTADRRGGSAPVVVGQYLGFAAILAVAVPAALGVRLLPEVAIPYFGLLPLLLGFRAGWQAWRERGRRSDDEVHPEDARTDGLGVVSVAAVTFANGGDNIAVYVPVFATAGTDGLVVYVVVFLALVAVWCAIGRYLATRQRVAQALARWGHLVLPVVLVALGLAILIEGDVFGL